jgi:hypothetical protein
MGFTRRGEQCFVQWVTSLTLNVEEHIITQSVVALGRVKDWRALEIFAEYGPWDLPDRLWHGYSVVVGDDSNWVALGALLPSPTGPAHFLPAAGRLYFRRAQLPVATS